MQPLRPIVSAGGPGGRDLIAIAVLCAAGALAAGTLLPGRQHAPAPQPADPAVPAAAEPAPDRTPPATDSTDPAPEASPSAPRIEPDPDRAALKRLSDSALRRRAATRRELTDSPAPAPPPPADPEPPADAAPAARSADGVTLRRIGAAPLPGAEIPAFEAATGRLFVACKQGIAILSLNELGAPVVERMIEPESFSTGVPAAARPSAVTHVEADPAARGFIVALLTPESAHRAPGAALFLSTQDGSPIASLPVGFGPDACAFSDDGAWLVVVNEGEPGPAGPGSADDPPGSASVIDLRSVAAAPDLASLAPDSIRHVEFSGPAFARALASSRLRFPPGSAPDASLSIEPEGVALADGVAYITLQENNALAALDVERARWLRIAGLGEITQTIDSRDDGRIDISDTLRALPCPDGVACFTRRARTFLVTANEGDARDDNETEAARAAGLTLGARSLTVWDAHSLALVGDTGSAFEWAMAGHAPEWFNANNDGRPDARSPQRGPEPECVQLWERDGRVLAFVTLERPGAVAIVDLSSPESPRLIHLHVSARGGDSGPEGLTLIEAPHSPTGAPLLIAAFEASGTLIVYEIVTGG